MKTTIKWTITARNEPSWPGYIVGVRPEHKDSDEPYLTSADARWAMKSTEMRRERVWLELHRFGRSAVEPVDACWSDETIL